MIVLDASVVVELLINGPLAGAISGDLADRPDSFIVPHLLDVEAVSALRSLAAGRQIDKHDSGKMLDELAALPAERFPHSPLLGRVWELRHNFTAYDAVYIALAEATNSVLYTCDEKLRTGHQAQVRVFAR